MDLSELVEIHEISRLKYRYLRALDQKQWDDLAACLTEQATASYGGGAYEFDSRDAIVSFLIATMGSESVLSSHRCSHPEIDLLGPTEAVGNWALQDVVINQEHNVTIAGGAFYTDRYVKLDGRWLIAHTGYRRTYEEIFPRGSVQGLTVTADWWATGGRSKLRGR